MNTEDTIIALLNGDISDVTEVQAVLQEIAGSPGKLQLLLEYTTMTGGLRELGMQALPDTGAVQGVMDGIAGIESEYQPIAASSSEQPGRMSAPWRSVLAGALLGLGFLAGLFFAGSDRDGNVQAAVSSASGGGAGSSGLSGLSERSSYLFAREDSGETGEPVPGVEPDSLAAENLGLRRLLENALNTGRDIALQHRSHEDPDTTLDEAVQLVVPSGGEEFSIGDRIPVVWNSRGDERPVQLEVSSDGGVSWSLIAGNLNGPRYLWRVPDDAVISDDYLMRIRSVSQTGEYIPDGEFPAGDASVDAIDISPDGTLLASNSENSIILWDIKTRTKIRTLRGHLGLVYFLRFSPDGKHLVSSSVDDHAMIWNVADGKAIHRLDGDGGTMWRAAFSPDGSRIATAQDDGSVILWDVTSGRKIRRFSEAHEQGVRYLEFTPDGKHLLTSSADRTAAILEIATGKRLLQVVHHPKVERARATIVNGVQLTPDGSTLITCGYDGYVKFWDARTGKLIREKVYHGGAYVLSIRLSRNGKWLTAVGYDGSTKVLDPYTGKILADLTLNNGEEVSPMVRSAYGLNDGILAISHADGRISLWQLKQENDVSEGTWTIRACDDQTGIDRSQDGDTINSTPVDID